MSYLDGIKAGWNHVPGTKTLTHTSQADGSETLNVKANIDAGGPSFREVQAGGPAGIEPTDTIWNVWAATLAAAPGRGDILTEADGAEWTILTFSPVRAEGEVIKWRCVCRERVVAA